MINCLDLNAKKLLTSYSLTFLGVDSDIGVDDIPSFSTLHSVQLFDNNYYLHMEDVSDEEGVPEGLKNTPDYEELIWLKRIRREKEFEQREGRTQPTKHLGYKCDGCGQDPILGGRFTCVDCAKKEHSIDLCCECAPNLSQIPNIGIDYGHKHEHMIRPVRKREGNDLQMNGKRLSNTLDRDYLIESKLGNYLDPNYQYFK